MAFIKRNIFPALAAALLVMVVVALGERGFRLWQAYTPAIEWQGVEVVTKEVEPGGDLTIVYTAIVNRTCPADIRGFLVAEDGSVPVRYPVVSGGYTKPSASPIKIRVQITIPQNADAGLGRLMPGPYKYRTLATRYCPDGVQEDSAVPDAPFNIVPRTD